MATSKVRKTNRDKRKRVTPKPPKSPKTPAVRKGAKRGASETYMGSKRVGGPSKDRGMKGLLEVKRRRSK